METFKVLLAGSWRDSDHDWTFQAYNPATGKELPGDYPNSNWADLDSALDAAQAAARELRRIPGESIGRFLEAYARRIEARSTEICQLASLETALPLEPRLAKGELPRTTGQLRQAAQAATQGHWTTPVIDSAANIRTHFGPIGPVAVFGPNNFPLAFGSLSGGDFAAALAAGNPVIGKAHPLHPGTSRLLAEEAQLAADETGLPSGTVQMIYNTSFSDGERLAADPRLAAIAFTGSRKGGLKLKAVADKVGKPIYLELGSVNPIVILPGALAERSTEIAGELAGSCLMGTGQFCTNPGLVVLEKGEAANAFINDTVARFQTAPSGVLFSRAGLESLNESVANLTAAGAEPLLGASPEPGSAFRFANTVLRVSGQQFLSQPKDLQAEAFGNATLFVESDSVEQTALILESLEGNLTGCIYSATDGTDDKSYDRLAPELRERVGRLLNDQMPTGVAVSPAMNHGGPFPATAHPGFSAVGIPGSLLRFAMLQCYDNVRPHRLPPDLRDQNEREIWRCVDGQWTQASL